MSIDLNDLSAKELDALIAQAKKRRTTLSKRKPIALVRKKLAALARAEGYTVAELFGGAPASSTPKTGTAAKSARKSTKGYKLGKVAPKYRNPADPSQTWAGRGQQPKWLASQLGGSKRLEDFLIK
ncbi:MAG TPA: H-NS histone family protein [Lysobacter sp.]|jgi:DNA-binding protein H-NS|nr:H-NS histone family protein [Lysobacter sp.]